MASSTGGLRGGQTYKPCPENPEKTPETTRSCQCAFGLPVHGKTPTVSLKSQIDVLCVEALSVSLFPLAHLRPWTCLRWESAFEVAETWPLGRTAPLEVVQAGSGASEECLVQQIDRCNEVVVR